jgi:phosphoenolpyruvate carboxykinase (ATP)
MIAAALESKLDNAEYELHPIFEFMMPTSCPGVPSEILNPRNTWADKDEYDAKAKDLAKQFIKNFEKYASGASEETAGAAPKI